MTKRIVVGISGSSAPIYGIRLLESLVKMPSVETHLVLSEAAELTLRLEMPGWTRPRVEKLADHVYSPSDLAASISSGSFLTHGMVVIPCSMKTLANIAHSTGGDLLCRAADVTLKERRLLILAPRETPFHLGHLRNMTAVAEMGGVILPPIPAFYHQPKTVDDLIHHTIGKILDMLRIEHRLFRRWSTPSQAGPARGGGG
ncbi:MAG: UbiX family flavin prenyltransferase [Verrucomicrobia bacterium]|nr:UbiX family flavin prenyltransferase [Verrucomicrobiota bacterium]